MNKQPKKPLTAAQLRRVKELRRMTPAEWEAICKHCGVCCLMKCSMELGIIGKSDTVYLRRCCENLDIKSKQCRVYGGRLSCDNCKKVTLDIVLADELLPASCGYVEYIFGPARNLAQPDWSKITHISDADFNNLTPEQIYGEVIPESLLWAQRYQKTK